METDPDPEDDAEAAPGQAPARRASASKPAVRTRLDPQVAAGLGRCLRARLAKLDRDIVYATELAAREPFYSHWAEHLVKMRAEAASHLSEFEGDGGTSS